MEFPPPPTHNTRVTSYACYIQFLNRILNTDTNNENRVRTSTYRYCDGKIKHLEVCYIYLTKL